MQLIVEHVAIAMETMSHDPDTVHWGCKVLAHAASNGEPTNLTLCVNNYSDLIFVNQWLLTNLKK